MNILETLSKKLCTGCSFCEIVCPQKAIEMKFNSREGQYLPILNETLCDNCSICFKSCSGNDFDFDHFNDEIYPDLPNSKLTGHTLVLYRGFSKEKNIRYHSATGGALTSFLIYILENKVVDAVLIARYSKKGVLLGETYLSENREEIVEGQGSIYTNVSWALPLEKILNTSQKIAVVGLPCHIQGLLKASELFPKFKERIILKIGLFCAGTYKTTPFWNYFKKMKVKSSEIKEINFRYKTNENDWPGHFRILTKKEEIITKRQYHFKAYHLKRCFFCYDKLCDFSDIAFGDDWLARKPKGQNIIIVRTEKAKNLLENSNLSLEKIDEDYLIQAQGMDRIRNRHFHAVRKVAKSMRQKLPKDINSNKLKTGFSDYFFTLLELINFMLAAGSFHKAVKIYSFFEKRIKKHIRKITNSGRKK